MSEARDVYVLTVETAGNQSYIFASNKLREQIGASQLVHEATTVWLLDALGWPDPRVANDPTAFHQALREQPPLDQGAPSEIMQAPSGRAIVVFRDRAAAIAAGRHVTSRALRRAPGLDVSCGVADADWSTPGSLKEAIGLADRDRGRRAAEAPGALARHLRLPIVADCDTSAFPAAVRDRNAPDATDDRAPARSAAARAKGHAAQSGVQRMAQALAVTGRIASNPDKLLDMLEKELGDGDRIGWLAVVHADGNGVGERFIKRSRQLADVPNAEYLSEMRELSLRVDEAALDALRAATSELVARDDRGMIDATEILPLVPFIVGGDDLTVLLAGADALRFVCAYLRATGTAQETLVCRAGIAFVKPHFPLHSAYALSSELAESAKRAKQYDVPALDFHVLYDTGVPDLEEIRASMAVDGNKTRLHGRPYVLADPSADAAWVEQHRFAHVEHAASGALERGESGERLLPRSQLAALRAALQHGHRIADQQLRLVAHRYQAGLASVAPTTNGTPSLFIDAAGEPGTRFTRLPDVVDLIELASLRSLPEASPA